MHMLYDWFKKTMKGQTTSPPLDDESIVLLEQLQGRLEGEVGQSNAFFAAKRARCFSTSA